MSTETEDFVDPFFEAAAEAEPTPREEWAAARAERSGPDALEPVTIVQRRDHAFKKKKDKKPRCAIEGCNRGKANPVHLGAPGSLNLGGSGGNRFIYQNTKKAWQAIFTSLLEQADLPRGLGYVLVTGRMCFPTRGRRDQGNFRYMVEKALGDALHEGGWLPDDDWLHYEFGRLAMVYEKGASWTELTLYPEWDEKERAAPQGTLL